MRDFAFCNGTLHASLLHDGDRMRPLVLFLILFAPFTPIDVVQQAATAAACVETNPPRPVPANCYDLCKVQTCGGQLWGGGLIRYHITKSIGGRTFTDADMTVIRSAAEAWN